MYPYWGLPPCLDNSFSELYIYRIEMGVLNSLEEAKWFILIVII
jgi:hypothetical protein